MLGGVFEEIGIVEDVVAADEEAGCEGGWGNGGFLDPLPSWGIDFRRSFMTA